MLQKCKFVKSIKEKRVLFITTKNIDYLRNTQELEILKENADFVDVVYSTSKSYVKRIIQIWCLLFKYNVNNIDVVFIGFAPQLILPLFFAKFRKKVIIIDFFISVYDTLIHDRKIFRDKGVIAYICHYLDSITIKRAEYIIADTIADAKYFIKEFKGDKDKFEVLYLEADKSIYYPREQHKRADLENKFVVLYFGSILPLQGVDVVLEAVKLLKYEKNIFFQMIGPVSKRYSKPMQDNVEYIEWLNQEKLAEYIANADLCLAGHFSGNIDKAKRTIPGKAYIYEAMGKKMVLGANGANLELYHESNSLYVEQGNYKQLANVILDCYRSSTYKK